MGSGFLKKEKKKIKEIQGIQDKLLYIWDYYKLWIVGFLALIVAGIYFLTRLSSAHSEYWFYLILANTMEDVGTGSRLYKEYLEQTDFDLKEKSVAFNNQIYFDFTLNTTGNTYFESFIVLSEAGTLDAITMESNSLTALGQTGRLMDLDSEEAAPIKAKYEDRFLYYETEDEEGNPVSYPVGIDVTDSILMTEYHIYGKTCALGLGINSHNIEATEKFLDYILNSPSAQEEKS
ncbi:MAG: hypothetical protein IKG67_04690 [Parasporobacterium sp.]|nr:hypothetical protein [Parasporobacterium sp.]